ncbi:F-box domain containing protein [Tanacetum coccineum]
MKKNTKIDVADDYSSFSCLPDEMVLQILSKLVDFKTLCLCKLVSKRFWRIVHQVDTICFTSFTDPFADPPSKEVIPSDTLASLGSYWSAIMCLMDFGRVKSLRIQVPSFFDNNHLLFKWKIKFRTKVDSFIFLSPNSVFPNKESYVNANGQEEEDIELYRKKKDIAFQCLEDVVVKFRLLMHPITSLPLLQDVSLTDPGQKVRVSLNGEKVAKMRNLSEAGELKKLHEDIPYRMSKCYVPLLKLPVSGYVMKGVTLLLLGRNDLLDDDIDISGYVMKGATLFLCERDDLPEGNDGSMRINNLNVNVEDKDEATYSEAVKEILKNHSATSLQRFLVNAIAA